jgi:hypothetical protein
VRRPERPSGGPADLGFVLALALVALLPRLYVAVAWSREPVWDGHYYHFGAERIAQGYGYSEDIWVNGHLSWRPWVHYPVGYSALLGAVYRVFGSGLLVAPLINAFAGTLLAVLGYRLARLYVGQRRAWLAGGLLALHPGLLAYSALVMTELVSATLVAAIGWLLLAYRGRTAALVAASLLLGAATLLRPSLLLLIPVVVLTQPGGVLKGASNLLLVSALTFLVVLPWTYRNCRRFDGCALVSTNGGWNLAIGAISDSGRFQTLRASDGCAVVSGQVQQDRCWAAVGKRRIAENPGRWLGLIPRKLAETFDHESFAFEYLHEADPVSWPEGRRVAGRELTSLFHRLLMIAAALGVIARPRLTEKGRVAGVLQAMLLAAVFAVALRGLGSEQHPVHWLALFIPLAGLLPLPGRPRLGPAGIYIVGFIACTVVTHAIFFGEDRYHMVVTPFLCVLAAGALRPSMKEAASRRIAQPRRKVAAMERSENPA